MCQLEYCIHQIPFTQHAAPPIIDQWNDEGQEPQTVVGWQDGQTEQIPKTDQHEEMLQAASLAGQCAHLFMDREAIQNFGEGVALALGRFSHGLKCIMRYEIIPASQFTQIRHRPFA